MLSYLLRFAIMCISMFVLILPNLFCAIIWIISKSLLDFYIGASGLYMGIIFFVHTFEAADMRDPASTAFYGVMLLLTLIAVYLTYILNFITRQTDQAHKSPGYVRLVLITILNIICFMINNYTLDLYCIFLNYFK